MLQYKKKRVKVEVFFDSLEELLKGNCEVVTNTKNFPYGTWKMNMDCYLEIEVDEES